MGRDGRVEADEGLLAALEFGAKAEFGEGENPQGQTHKPNEASHALFIAQIDWSNIQTAGFEA